MNPQERSVAAIVAGAQRAVAESEEVLREIVAAGWELDQARVSLTEDGTVSSITACGEYADRNLIRLRVDLWQDGGIREMYIDDPSHGVEVPISEGKVPTPDEADEAYDRELRQLGKLVTNEYQTWKKRRVKEATR